MTEFYEGECFGGPWDGRVFKSQSPTFDVPVPPVSSQAMWPGMHPPEAHVRILTVRYRWNPQRKQFICYR